MCKNVHFHSKHRITKYNNHEDACNDLSENNSVIHHLCKKNDNILIILNIHLINILTKKMVKCFLKY